LYVARELGAYIVEIGERGICCRQQRGCNDRAQVEEQG
jgi:hypothetical protein